MMLMNGNGTDGTTTGLKFFGRSPERLFAALWSLPSHLCAMMRCLFLFRQPIKLLLCYLMERNPQSGQVQLRNGIILHLSKDSSDIVTVYLIFCRRDYGVIKPGTSIIDVGANLVKMDCEGGEYDIILNTEASMFDRVDEIRLEYHRGPKKLLFSAIETYGYNILFLENGANAGVAWCSRGL